MLDQLDDIQKRIELEIQNVVEYQKKNEELTKEVEHLKSIFMNEKEKSRQMAAFHDL